MQVPGVMLRGMDRGDGLGLANWAEREQADDTPRHRATYVRNSICAREGQERPQGGRIPWSGH
jgi:hypothetical protein